MRAIARFFAMLALITGCAFLTLATTGTSREVAANPNASAIQETDIYMQGAYSGVVAVRYFALGIALIAIFDRGNRQP